jgi:ABC-type oligopeptide transport system substrate-binding subunit
MKNNIVRLFVFNLILFTIVASCSKKDSGSTTPATCNFGTNTVTTNSSVPVTYSASNQTSGTIASLTYLGRNGVVVVTSPALPWTVTDTIPQGKSVNITAVGTAPPGGTLYLSYSIAYTNGIVSNSTACGN